MRYRVLFCGAITFFITVLLDARPRVSLVYFEKDLQNMSKKSENLTIKTGSFIDCVAEKRRKKELIEQEITALQQDVDGLKKEIAQHETIERELLLCIAEQKSRLEQRMYDMQHIVVELAQACNALHSTA